MMKTMLGGCGISERVCQSDPCVADGDRRTDGGKQVRPTIKLRRTEYAQSSPDEIANDAQSPRPARRRSPTAPRVPESGYESRPLSREPRTRMKRCDDRRGQPQYP